MKMYQNRLSEGSNSICCYPKISQIKKYIKSALHIRSLSQSETKNPISTETVYDETNNWLFVIQLKYNQWGTFVVDTTVIDASKQGKSIEVEAYLNIINKSLDWWRQQKIIYHKVFPVSEFSPSLAYKYGRESNRKGMIK